MIPSQMLKGVLEGCILSVIDKKQVYGYEISQMLGEYGFGMISEGTIYPILLRIEKNQWVDTELKESPTGPKRKYYYLNQTGREKLREFKESWVEITKAVEKVIDGGQNE